MTNFDKQLIEALNTYSSIDGRSVEELREECLKNPEGQCATNIKLIMFAAM